MMSALPSPLKSATEKLRLNIVAKVTGAARYASGLGVNDFVKRTTFLSCDPASLAKIGPAAITLAEAEGLHAHARSVSIRLGAAS